MSGENPNDHGGARAADSHGLGPAGAGYDSCPLMPTYGPPQLSIVSGHGSWVLDAHDNEYLDALCGLAVTSLGHANSAVAAAISRQAHTLLHTSNLFANPIAGEVARELDVLIGDGTPAGGQVFFCNSGAEANECAIKLARRWAGPPRHEMVSAYGSFHGRTLATLHLTGQPQKHEAFQPLPPGFRHVAFADISDLDRALDASRVAAVVLESVQGEGGVNPLPVEYVKEVRRLCSERGVLLGFDEVQTGLGRTGRWFGFQHFDVEPDIVTVAKALGNGVPIGACWARREVASAFRPGDHATTYGGNALVTAAARAVLAEMRRLDVATLAREKGAQLRDSLSAVDGVGQVRGLGLLLAAELEPPLVAADVAAAALAAGLIVNAVNPTAIRLAPSLLVTDEELALIATRLARAISAVASSQRD